MIHVRAIAARGRTACAALESGALACWGSDEHDRFAGHTRFVRRPVLVDGIATATSVCVGDTHLCTLDDQGRVACRGDGPAGRAASEGLVSLPHVVEITCGSEHACARAEDGSVRCWGDGSAGQLGSSSVIRASAVRVAS
jgi:alpha-tubulin suppressor-like RCC1 family protein